ncbi:hypothetical protein [Myxococcus landrumensis]|uniref:Uncharacterized protein n=1 Tax=Myxococcus landrumensis TaxID=2813577 RepID=A0ABX7N2T9_9BACT|nr:hypothetical protein [Myxococcus landrumus]QSQ13017.1 hypothetical protein JY572_32425 [Myxococcus landrumus]
MNRKLCILGAVLGTVPGFVPDVSNPVAMGVKEPRREARAASRDTKAAHTKEVVEHPSTSTEVEPRGHTRSAREPEVPIHPCELKTVVKVPCDETQELCEFTYWECPAAVNPLRA